MISNVFNGDIYASDVYFLEDGTPTPTCVENLLTDYEIKNLK